MLLKIIPARDPKQCGGSKKRMYYDDDDGDDDDVRPCAVEIRMSISEEPFCVEI